MRTFVHITLCPLADARGQKHLFVDENSPCPVHVAFAVAASRRLSFEFTGERDASFVAFTITNAESLVALHDDNARFTAPIRLRSARRSSVRTPGCSTWRVHRSPSIVSGPSVVLTPSLAI
jgi:hypothetical protein